MEQNAANQFKRMVLFVALIMLPALSVGCGGDENAQETAAKPKALVPAAMDSVMAGTGVDETQPDSAPVATAESQSPNSVEKRDSEVIETVKAVVTEPEKSDDNNPFHRPQVREVGGDFSLQLGSYSNADNAAAQAGRIRDLGYDPAVEVASLAGQTYHRVVVTGLADRAEAEKLGEHLRNELGITYLIRQK